MTKFQKAWIENESLRPIMLEGVNEATRQLKVKFWVNADGKIRGNYTDEQYMGGILEEANDIALEYVYENQD